MEKDKLEQKLVKEFFKDLNRALVCPVQQCKERGKHFRCYDSSYENCSGYLTVRYK